VVRILIEESLDAKGELGCYTRRMGRRRRNRITRIANWLSLALVAGAVGSAAFVYIRWVYREQRWNQLIEEIAPRYGVDKFLVKAVMRQESRFDPFARSKTGAVGLMQVMPGTGKTIGYSETQLWNARDNIEAGTWLLADALSYWSSRSVDDPVPFALAEYYTGRGNVLRWAPPGRSMTAREFEEAIGNSGVLRYVQKVTVYWEQYQARGHL